MTKRQIKFRLRVRNNWTGNGYITFTATLEDIITFSDFYEEKLGKKYTILSIEQFTGCYDKDNNEIYEGDIVVATRDSGKLNIFQVRIKGVIGYANATFGIVLIGVDPLRYFKNVKVIGKIYENPELLK
jgi:hypothetical protein